MKSQNEREINRINHSSGGRRELTLANISKIVHSDGEIRTIVYFDDVAPSRPQASIGMQELISTTYSGCKGHY